MKKYFKLTLILSSLFLISFQPHLAYASVAAENMTDGLMQVTDLPEEAKAKYGINTSSLTEDQYRIIIDDLPKDPDLSPSQKFEILRRIFSKDTSAFNSIFKDGVANIEGVSRALCDRSMDIMWELTDTEAPPESRQKISKGIFLGVEELLRNFNIPLEKVKIDFSQINETTWVENYSLAIKFSSLSVEEQFSKWRELYSSKSFLKPSDVYLTVLLHYDDLTNEDNENFDVLNGPDCSKILEFIAELKVNLRTEYANHRTPKAQELIQYDRERTEFLVNLEKRLKKIKKKFEKQVTCAP